MKQKLWFALPAYLVLAVVAWQTLSDGKIRLVTLAILGMFAVRTLAHSARKNAERASE